MKTKATKQRQILALAVYLATLQIEGKSEAERFNAVLLSVIDESLKPFWRFLRSKYPYLNGDEQGSYYAYQGDIALKVSRKLGSLPPSYYRTLCDVDYQELVLRRLHQEARDGGRKLDRRSVILFERGEEILVETHSKAQHCPDELADFNQVLQVTDEILREIEGEIPGSAESKVAELYRKSLADGVDFESFPKASEMLKSVPGSRATFYRNRPDKAVETKLQARIKERLKLECV